MRTTRTGTANAAQARRGDRDRHTPAPAANAPQAARDPLRDAPRYAILSPSFRNTGVAPRPNMKNTNHQNICPAGIRSTFSCVGATLVSAGRLSKHEVAPMNTKTNKKNGRKATSNAATSAAKKNHTATSTQREQARTTRWGDEIEAYLARVCANRRDEYALITAAAEVAGMTPAAFILDAMKRERGLTAKPTAEAQCARRTDEDYEQEPTRKRNAHEREAVAEAVTRYSFMAGKLTETEKVEVVRQFFQPGDRSLSEAEGRAIRAALTGAKGNHATWHTPTGEKIAAAIDAAAEHAANTYGDVLTLAEMFAGATVEESDEPTQPGVFVMATAPDFTHAGMFATALAAAIFNTGCVLTDATPYGEMEADDGNGYHVSWYIENRRKATNADRRKGDGMRYGDYSPDTRKAIKALADKRGTTPEAVCARFEELYKGNRRKANGKPDEIFGKA